MLQAPAASICQAAATKLLTCEARAAGYDAADTPTKRTCQQRGYGPKAGAIAGEAMTKRGPQESDEPGEAEGHAKPSPEGKRLATGQEHLNERDVERDDGKNERGEAARNNLFRVDETDISAAEQQQADDAEKEHVFARPQEAKAAPAAPGQQSCPRDKEARSGEQQRRHLRNANADGRIGRAPEDIYGGKGKHNSGSGCGSMFPGARME